MTVLVGRRESFNAAHQLCDPDLSDDENRRLFGKCANLHDSRRPTRTVISSVLFREFLLTIDHTGELVAERGRPGLAELSGPPGPRSAVCVRVRPDRAGRTEPAGPDEAAAAVGIGRALAVYYLDKLVQSALLTASYRRPWHDDAGTVRMRNCPFRRVAERQPRGGLRHEPRADPGPGRGSWRWLAPSRSGPSASITCCSSPALRPSGDGPGIMLSRTR